MASPIRWTKTPTSPRFCWWVAIGESIVWFWVGTMWSGESVFDSGTINGVWWPLLCLPWPWWSGMPTHQQSWVSSAKNSVPWITSALIILSVNPIQPMIRTEKGFSILSTWTKRSNDWRNIESARARRKTPLKNAPIKQSLRLGIDFGSDECLPTSSARWNANVNLTVWI